MYINKCNDNDYTKDSLTIITFIVVPWEHECGKSCLTKKRSRGREQKQETRRNDLDK